MKRKVIASRLNFVESCIGKIFSDKDSSNNLFDNIDKPQIIKKRLQEKTWNLAKSMNNEQVILKSDAYDFLLEIERYLGELSKIDLFILFFGLRPSVLFNKIFVEKYIKVDEFKCYMKNVGTINNLAHRCIMNFKEEIFQMERNEYYIPCSNLLKESILLKWKIEIGRVHVFNSANELEKFNSMLVYSVNPNDILVEELANIVQNAMNIKSKTEIKKIGLIKIHVPSNIYMVSNFGYYEFSLSNKKKYIMKIFDLEKHDNLPPGLSTTYLNCNCGFQSFGYMGVMMASEAQIRYVFLSIEEKPSFYLSLKDLGIFKNNVIQALYFLLYILELLNSLDVYKIKLHKRLTFAVDNSDDNKWRFRLEDVGDFKCYKNESLFKNHEHLILIINEFLKHFRDQIQLNFFRNLRKVANDLNRFKDKEYFIILTTLINDELRGSKDEPEATCTLKQCIIQ